jgi:pimeloyl-ACP methyl ester carboxylesterase
LKYCYRFALIAALMITGLSGVLPARARLKQSTPDQNVLSSPLKPCKVQGVEEELLCGKLPVFENRKSGVGRQIDLNVVVLPALERGRKEAPLFDLQGGPGIAATTQARWYATDLKEYRRRRDVVLVDQRGTGDSNPLLCGTKESGNYLAEMYPIKYVQDCRRKLERVADLTQYTTPAAMDDLDDVRAWLGYDKINLIGLSYGTRAALVYMRQHPERVRSVVLMGVAPTYSKLPLYHARNGQRAMLLLLDECAADAACMRAYLRVRQELAQLLERLARQPARVGYVLPVTKKEVAVEIKRDVFAEQLRSQMYEPTGARRLPFIIHRAAQGDFTPFLKIAIHDDPPSTASDFSIADGMYLSVTCAEDVPLIDPKEAEQLNRDTFFGNYRVIQQRRACRHWARAALPAGYDKPVASDAPVLIFSGYMDPVTPPEWGAEVASHLPNSKHVVIRHHAHVPVGLTNIECLDKVTLEFLERGSVNNLDTSCLDQMLPPPFFVEQPAAHR